MTPSSVRTGKELYARYCQLCHGAEGKGYAADNAPSLVSRTFLESATERFIAHGIRMGRPGTAMAAYGKLRGGPLDEQAIHAIVAFLRWKGPAHVAWPEPAPGDAKRGSALFEKNCATCHGTTLKHGSALSLYNPELLLTASGGFLAYAIEHGRPPTPMPSFGGKLTPGEIGDLVAWLTSLSPTQPTPPVLNPVVPDDLPIVINPKGARPTFNLRDGRFVPAAEVKRALDRKQRIVIIDARPPSDWIQFRIPGAISLPYHDPSHLDRIPKDGTWVVAYCACPHHASGEVVDLLRAKSYPNTAVLDEGILVWKTLGYPVVGEAITPDAGAPKP